MRLALRCALVLSLFCVILACTACPAQNGPTPPSVTLHWIQAPAGTNPIAKNCVYRGTASGVYTLPALFCSTAPIISYKDLQVTRGTKYFYAVTASDSVGAESAYSAEVDATPPIINSPTGLGTTLTELLFPGFPNSVTTASRDGRLKAVAQ